MPLPRLYAILDRALLPQAHTVTHFAEELLAAGVELIQYRNKQGSARQVLAEARELKRLVISNGDKCKLILNDRADLALLANFDGVHLGQDDLPIEDARRIFASSENPKLLIGCSTHNEPQLITAASADYLALGPIFATRSKDRPDPVVGLEGLRRARALTKKPLVAIGGITRANVKEVLAAGADSVAVISDLLGSPRESASDFLRLLR